MNTMRTLSMVLSAALSPGVVWSSPAAVSRDAPGGARVALCASGHFEARQADGDEALYTVDLDCARGGVTTLGHGRWIVTGSRGGASVIARVNADGVERWSYTLGAEPWGPATIDGVTGIAWVALTDGELVGVDTVTGSVTLEGWGVQRTEHRQSVRAWSPVVVRTRSGRALLVANPAGAVLVDARKGQRLRALEGEAWPTVSAPPVAFDLDGDGVDELLWASEGALRLVSQEGAPRWTWVGPTRASIMTAAIVVPGDRPTILTADTEGWVSSIDVVTGRAFPWTPRRATGAVLADLRVGDVDGDGALDVVALTRGATLHAWTLSNGDAVTLSATADARGPAVDAPALVAGGDGALRLVFTDGDGAVRRATFAATARSTSESVLVGDTREAVRDVCPTGLCATGSALPVTPLTTPAPPPRVARCNTSPSSRGANRFALVVLFAVSVARRRRQSSRSVISKTRSPAVASRSALRSDSTCDDGSSTR
jgi:hypothetical protein